MIRVRPSWRPFLLVVLTLFFCGTTAFAETWEPVSRGFSTDIVISTSGGSTSAEVKLTFPNSGYRVPDWGAVTRTDNEFSVDAKVERWTGLSAQMITTITHVYTLGALSPGTYSFAVKAYGLVVARNQFTIGSATPATPRLLTEEDMERAIALESVTMVRPPSSLAPTRQFSSDAATRVMLFATDIDLVQGETPSTITAQAEDSQQTAYPLSIEYAGRVPGHSWLTQLIIKIPTELKSAGDIWVSIKVGSINSNKVLISATPPND